MIEIPEYWELAKVEFYVDPEGDDWSMSLGYTTIETDREGNSKNRFLIVETQFPPQEAIDLLRENIEQGDASSNDIRILQILKGYDLI